MAAKSPAIPGFSALSDQVFVRPGSVDVKPSTSDPDTVIIYGWGDGQGRHVAKYADGYRRLFPHAKQVVVLSPIIKGMFSDLRQRSEYMVPVVEAMGDEDSALVHAMSNTGAANYAATLHAYRLRNNEALPHQLLIMDSTPGSTDLTPSNVMRWSRAMAMGTASWFPWPTAVTQAIWGVFLCVHSLYWWMLGRESAGAWSRRAVNDERYEAKGARKLYMYSKEDELISWEDIERHAAETKERGWEAEAELFQGSGHVGHMRQSPAQYWTAIGRAWRRAAGGES
ncbi:PaxU [Hirsutella rhossiliensis]|uniref:PaxU n=1 Tax=Hirsutella rhossiliensis TaxID=111463 RepID=A0A9P8MP12_9HYPO|nr:PaxU [Hirsutella rhossiliensis]KAH0958645.1 PaxU [Hirsutella rhossiliensis]